MKVIEKSMIIVAIFLTFGCGIYEEDHSMNLKVSKLGNNAPDFSETSRLLNIFEVNYPNEYCRGLETIPSDTFSQIWSLLNSVYYSKYWNMIGGFFLLAGKDTDIERIIDFIKGNEVSLLKNDTVSAITKYILLVELIPTLGEMGSFIGEVGQNTYSDMSLDFLRECSLPEFWSNSNMSFLGIDEYLNATNHEKFAVLCIISIGNFTNDKSFRYLGEIREYLESRSMLSKYLEGAIRDSYHKREGLIKRGGISSYLKGVGYCVKP